jgi:hypothetical protein
LSALILALAGAIAALPFFLRRFQTPFFVTIAVSEYRESDLPPNPLAEQDSESLLAFFSRQVKATGGQQRDRFIQELTNLQSQRDNAVVVHLCAHALSHDGEVYLLPDNADLGNSSTWLSLTDVLRLMVACPSSHKLLILDITHPLLSARAGLLIDDVAGRLQDRLEHEDIPDGLFVLCSCARGQSSHAAEGMSRSVFAHYLCLGLSGRCDGSGPKGKQDERLTLQELYAYVRPRVDRWARDNRGVRQTPLLFGHGEDFILAQANTAPAPDDMPEPRPYPTTLQEGWTERDRWWEDGRFRIAPGAFRQREAVLMRAERRWRAGIKPERVEGDLKDELKECDERMEQAKKETQAGSDFRPRSLAQARGLGAQPVAAIADALGRLLPKLDDPALMPKDRAKLLDDFRKEEAIAKASFADLAGTAFLMLAEEPNRAANRIATMQEVIDAMTPPQPYVETLLIGRLAAHENRRKWPAEAVPRLIQAVREAEELLASEPHLLGWHSAALTTAAEKRRSAEQLLFLGKRPDWDRAVSQLEDAANDYRKINRQIAEARRAERLCDEAFALLPGYEPYLAAQSGGDLKDWNGALGAVLELYPLLTRPAEEGPPPAEELGRLTDTLQGHLDGLRRPFLKAESQPGAGSGSGGVAAYREMQTLLAAPRLNAHTRQDLQQAAQTVSCRLSRATLELNSAEEPKGGANLPDRQESGSPGRRVRLSLDLLKLAGLPEERDLRNELEQAESAPTDAAWQTLGTHLRTAWRDALPGRLRGAPDRVADRIDRLLDTPSRDRTPSPIVALRRQQGRHYWQWLGTYYQAESDSPLLAGHEDWRDYYSKAARDAQNLGR